MSNFSRAEIDTLIVDFLSGDISPEEKKKLLFWVESSDNHRDYFIQMRDIWMNSAEFKSLHDDQIEQALKRLHAKVRKPSISDRRLEMKKMKKPISQYRILKYAATIAVLVVTIYGFNQYFLNRWFENHRSETIYEAHYGSKAVTILPDSSKVWLNSGSKLSYHSDYNFKERKVHLTGEAYFDVKTNPEKAFVVKAGNLQIKATGTEFNVKAYPEESQIITTLVKGIVTIEGVDKQQKAFTYEMKPNQSVFYNSAKDQLSPEVNPVITSEQQEKPTVPAPATVKIVNTELYTSWTKDQWIIDNINFGDLAILIERRFDVQISFESGSEKLRNFHFTGKIEKETLEQIFEIFQYSIPFKYKIIKDQVSLTLDERLEKKYQNALEKQ